VASFVVESVKASVGSKLMSKKNTFNVTLLDCREQLPYANS